MPKIEKCPFIIICFGILVKCLKVKVVVLYATRPLRTSDMILMSLFYKLINCLMSLITYRPLVISCRIVEEVEDSSVY